MLLRRAGRYPMGEGRRRGPVPWKRRASGLSVKLAVGLALILIAARAVLPIAVLRFANRTLDAIPGYDGAIADIDIALWRGAYAAEGVRLYKETGDISVPFLSIERVEISVDWGALIDGSVVAKILLDRPALNLVKAESKEKSQLAVDESWQKRVQELLPLRLDRLQIVDGRLSYHDASREPEIDVSIEDLDAVGENWSNRFDTGRRLGASFNATGRAFEQGRLALALKADPLAEQPTFELNAALHDAPVAQLNEFLKAYGGFDAESGELDLFVEAAAKDGAFEGYAKPMLRGVKIVGERDRRKPLLKKFWERIVGGAKELLENQPKARLAARVEFSGRFTKTGEGGATVPVWAAVVSVLRNAFIRALLPGFEHSVEVQEVEKPRGK